VGGPSFMESVFRRSFTALEERLIYIVCVLAFLLWNSTSTATPITPGSLLARPHQLLLLDPATGATRRAGEPT